MPSVHDFGIIENINNQIDFDDEYNPEKYNCIAVEDELVSILDEKLSGMKTYFHSLNRPEMGLAYFGVTIIPPDSLLFFYEAVTSSEHLKNSDELNKLILKIQQAIKEKKYMIHYGI